MGGRNSGRWYRVKDKRTTLNEVRRLDVRSLQREGYLRPWQSGIITWGRGDRCTAVVSYAMAGDLLVLSYDYKPPGGEWQPITQPLPLDWAPCHYGGKRPWFLCPQCQRRVAILAALGQRFLCRQCARLPYASQCETPEDRGLRHLRKIRDKVGAGHSILDHITMTHKPRGMHWRTFWRICEQEQAALDQVVQRLAAALPPGWR